MKENNKATFMISWTNGDYGETDYLFVSTTKGSLSDEEAFKLVKKKLSVSFDDDATEEFGADYTYKQYDYEYAEIKSETLEVVEVKDIIKID